MAKPSAAPRQPGPDRPELGEHASRQFGLPAMFWGFLILGVALAYLRRMDSIDILWGAIGSLGIALVWGAFVGWSTGQWADAIYWAIIISSAAYLSVASDRAYGPGHRLVWASIGAVTGALGATIAPRKLSLKIIVCGGAAGVLIHVLYWSSPNRNVDMQFDLWGAPVIGGLVAVLVWLILWLESRYRQPRYITASWLLAAVIVGNLLVPWVLI